MTYLYWIGGIVAAAVVVKLFLWTKHEAEFLGAYMGSSGKCRDLIIARESRRMKKLPPMTDEEEMEFLFGKRETIEEMVKSMEGDRVRQ